MIQLRTRNLNGFRRLARRLDGADRKLRSGLYKAINKATKPLKAEVRQSARKRLPRSGGLNRRVARSKMATKTATRGKNVGVAIVGTSGYDIGSINRGRVRHLTFGHLPWSNQSVRPGFWSEPLKAGGPTVRKEIVSVMRGVAKEIEKG